MSTQILRPTPKGKRRQEQPWLLQGAWGKREYAPMSETDFYDTLYDELAASGVMPADGPRPSRKHHGEVTDLIGRCSVVGDKWVPDLGPSLKELRTAKGLSQGQLAEASDVPLTTITDIEQGRVSGPSWAVLVRLARVLGVGLGQVVAGFVQGASGR